ncbi:MAG: SPOR domain-containing protein [Cyclobacteriaceae bacterium]|nr:SPOR domain-containing protein [Cyclobacteriaceae bacterium]
MPRISECRHFRISGLIIIAFLFTLGCVPRASKTAKVTEYSEDLSDFRPTLPSFDTNLQEESEEQLIRYVPPRNDITRRINYFLDTLASGPSEKILEVFTIQVYSGTKREEGNQARQKVYQLMPDSNPQLVYTSPFYRVKVGNYIDRIEANQHLTALKKEFPGALLVPERLIIH